MQCGAYWSNFSVSYWTSVYANVQKGYVGIFGFDFKEKPNESI